MEGRPASGPQDQRGATSPAAAPAAEAGPPPPVAGAPAAAIAAEKPPPDRAAWTSAVAAAAPLEMRDLYRPRFEVTRRTTVATAGSCFAQHFGRQLVERGFKWVEAEPPIPLVPRRVNEAHGYGLFSFRTGNIYTPRLLRQWLEWASGEARPPEEVWERDLSHVDPFRPAIEPNGYHRPDDVLAARQITLRAIADALAGIEVFVFTLGQTEAWHNTATGVTYPLCPGTAGGAFDQEVHRFANHGYRTCLRDMERSIAILRAYNPAVRILLTVSPVPMVATASGGHVLTANGRTKAVLRAVAGRLRDALPDVDYFPSYELIAEPPFRAIFYDPNMRTVCSSGVDFVMNRFFAAHGAAGPGGGKRAPQGTGGSDDLVCEEVMLEVASAR